MIRDLCDVDGILCRTCGSVENAYVACIGVSIRHGEIASVSFFI